MAEKTIVIKVKDEFSPVLSKVVENMQTITCLLKENRDLLIKLPQLALGVGDLPLETGEGGAVDPESAFGAMKLDPVYFTDDFPIEGCSIRVIPYDGQTDFTVTLHAPGKYAFPAPLECYGASSIEEAIAKVEALLRGTVPHSYCPEGGLRCLPRSDPRFHRGKSAG